jgi:hypothetical protein
LRGWLPVAGSVCSRCCRSDGTCMGAPCPAMPLVPAGSAMCPAVWPAWPAPAVQQQAGMPWSSGGGGTCSRCGSRGEGGWGGASHLQKRTRLLHHSRRQADTSITET